MNRFEYVNVTTLADAAALVGAEGVRLKAGGLDLLDQIKGQLIEPKRLVNLSRVPNANYIKREAGALKIGPLATLAQIAGNEDILKNFTALAHAAGQAATPQLRNMATVAGNLCQRPRCWYFRGSDFNCLKKGGDHCFAQVGENRYHAIFNNNICAIVHPSAVAGPLLAMGARLKVLANGKTRELALADFFTRPEKDVKRENVLQPNEVITEIIVPAPRPGSRSVYLKAAEKETFDWPVADVSVVLSTQGGLCRDVSIVLGAAEPVPHRAREAELLIKGKRVTEALVRRAAKAALEKATPLADNGYKTLMFDALIRRAVLQAV